MFAYIVAGLAVLAFGGIAVKEATKPTGEKIKAGDNAFVNADALRLAPSALGTSIDPIDSAALQAFLGGFLSTSVKVANVQFAGSDLTGNIIGFAKAVVFPKSAVNSIERNGRRIV